MYMYMETTDTCRHLLFELLLPTHILTSQQQELLYVLPNESTCTVHVFVCLDN